MSHYRHLDVRKLTPMIGAEVHGFDLREEPRGEVLDELTRALHDNLVIFFRDQEITFEQHMRVGRLFGNLQQHPIARARHPVHPELLVVHADENSKVVAGEDWHSDITCDVAPPMASMLHLKVVPPVGGDTMWASMYAALDALSPSMQAYLETLTAVHDGGKPYIGHYKAKVPEGGFPRSEHPVVTIHPATGRKVLFVNKGFTTHIKGLRRAESDALLEFLFHHIESPKFNCRFRWRANSIAFWDNRCTQHYAIFDYFPQVRTGHRVTISGAPPVSARSGTVESVARPLDVMAA